MKETVCRPQPFQKASLPLIGLVGCRRGHFERDPLRPLAVEITNPLVDVRVDGMERPGQVAGIEQGLPDGLHVIMADGVGEDRQQVVNAGARRPHRP